MTETLREWTHDGRPRLNRMGKSAPGPWDAEPDKRHWIDPATDMDCLMVRNGMGAWCGYVAVTEGHPFYGVGYSQCTREACEDEWCYEHSPDGVVAVHGGLTFADFCHESEDGEGHGICHTPLQGRPAKVWWLGFDCNHAGDMSPYDAAAAADDPSWPMLGDQYRDVAYVEAQCRSLAQQLTDLAAS